MHNSGRTRTDQSQIETKDLLWLNIRELPYFRALLRAVEGRYYRNLELKRPILDLGCGDGHFGSVTFDQKLDMGIDTSEGLLREAVRRGSYRYLIQTDGTSIPFPANYFGSVFSNSVLEHIPNVEKVLLEIGRVLTPGGLFVFSVPNHKFGPGLSIGRALDGLHLKPLGSAYRRFFNRIARHHHCDPPQKWEERLHLAGIELEKWWHFYTPSSLAVTEWGHFFGLPSLLIKFLTGKWILVPSQWNLAITYRLTAPHYMSNQEREDGVCTFFIGRARYGINSPLSKNL